MRIVVVGSGASAVHFAQSALGKGHSIDMIDVGRTRPDPILPEASFEDLKHELPDPAAYFLGERFGSVTLPGTAGEYYGFPPHKDYVFEGLDSLGVESRGFEPLFSFAQGGLAETWTGGVFPFHADELADFPFGYDDLAPFYDLVAERIGVAGTVDDLVRFHPAHRHLGPPLELDEHSRLLLERYERRRDDFGKLGFVLGRSRIAVLGEGRAGGGEPDASGHRQPCARLGRCLLGCPVDALYTPLATLRTLRRHDRFSYHGNRCVRFFRYDAGRTIRSVVTENIATGELEEMPVEALVLGAGTLSSARIFLSALARGEGEAPRLAGLMDNRQVLVPFLNPKMLRRPHEPDSYQYHQLTAGLAADDPRDYVHALITTLKTASIHPIVPRIPLDLRTALRIFRNGHAALGLVNVNFADDRRASSWVELEWSGGSEGDAAGGGPGEGSGGSGDRGGRSLLRIRYEPPAGEAKRMRAALGRLGRALRKLGCLVPPGLSHVRPMGASVHYAGTLPMTAEERPWTTTPEGRSRDFENLWFVDGTTFPFLPAKNLTFTLMANAARIAERAF